MSTQNGNLSNRRIAKNTLLLYFRMLLLLLISLYTSRIILNTLGINDYGIYNVVGGIVTMFSILSTSLSSAISRFITFELGNGNNERLKVIFSSSVTVQIIISLIIVILAETIGLWFLNTHLIIPEDRIAAARWCFHFSIITFVINLISIPYNAAIIAHEKMSAFAYISIIEAIGKLLIAASLSLCTSIDKLILYGVLLSILACFIRVIYGYYCTQHFEETKYNFIIDKNLLKQMLSFAGWNFIGSSASIIRDQGGNIILNMFFGPSVNAARGIAIKVNSVVTGFVQNFMIALNPQITKSYASGENKYMMELIFKGARFSYYLLFILSLPILLNTNYILVLWLKLVPDHTVSFIQLIIILALHETLATPLITAMLATGNIKKYQIIAGGVNLLNIPIAYIFLLNGFPPETTIIISIIFSIIIQILRLILLKEMINFPIMSYIKKVYVNVIIITIIAAIFPTIINFLLEEGLFRIIIVSTISTVSSFLVILFLGCSSSERKTISNKLLSKIKL